MIRELFSARVYQGNFWVADEARKAMRVCALDSHARYNPNAMPWSRESRHNILTAPESNGIFDALVDEVRRVVVDNYSCTPISMTAREVVVQGGQFIPLHAETTELSAVYWIAGQARPDGQHQNYAGALALVNPSGAYGSHLLPWEGWRSELIHPKPGTLVIFPSYLAHHSHPYNGTEPSVELHFEISLNPQDMKKRNHHHADR
jgi:hypothetical protein